MIEVKSPADAVGDISKTTQIEKYWHQYRLVLATNLRDWQLIGERDGERVTLERFELAASEPRRKIVKAFISAPPSPRSRGTARTSRIPLAR